MLRNCRLRSDGLDQSILSVGEDDELDDRADRVFGGSRVDHRDASNQRSRIWLADGRGSPRFGSIGISRLSRSLPFSGWVDQSATISGVISGWNWPPYTPDP